MNDYVIIIDGIEVPYEAIPKFKDFKLESNINSLMTLMDSKPELDHLKTDNVEVFRRRSKEEWENCTVTYLTEDEICLLIDSLNVISTVYPKYESNNNYLTLKTKLIDLSNEIISRGENI